MGYAKIARTRLSGCLSITGTLCNALAWERDHGGLSHPSPEDTQGLTAVTKTEGVRRTFYPM